ncbi:MAG: hypothetical protein WC011_01480 [Candidatus Paceibacterota bacterium]
MQENLLNDNQNKKIRVGIVRVLRDTEGDNTLSKAGEIFEFLNEYLGDKYKPLDIFVDRDNVWHISGIPIMPADLIHRVDVVWNQDYPDLSQLFSQIGIPYISTNPFLYVLENNKISLKKHVKDIGLYMPSSLVLEAYQEDIDGDIDTYSLKKAGEVFSRFGAPWIVRTNTDKNNEGVHVVKTFPDLINIIRDFAIHKKNILVEELIKGDRVSIHTVSNFRDENIYHFLPKNISDIHKNEILIHVKNLWKELNPKHYLNIDFILHPKRIYLNNISSSFDFKKDNRFHSMATDFGVKSHDIIENIIKNAILNK